ncbi:(+)-neomenthol dehydrogenase-like isoform X1 [Prunus dulcis]|uniref:(+)-neomenthol dehydrogenase-like isoform X1 n=1 Tax=Prunus dulcis TaxID=3755 RepID=UPI00148218AD|nr:(+)-neomenthol dehydrogenase-like isoform X1 [Prunus dulcis]
MLIQKSESKSGIPSTMAEVAKKYAVVTGSNQGIGFGTVRKLASNGIMVVLTALDEKMGVEAIEKLKECGLSDLVVFHQLDVTDTASIASLADFVKTQFGKLDILVNNAGVSGTIVDPESMRAAAAAGIGKDGVGVNWSEIMTQTYELAEVCVKTNYYGAKKMTKALLPLLQLSDSPRVVSLSSSMGSLKKAEEIDWSTISTTPNYELAEECLKTNYYGTKSVTAALLPLLQLSNSPRIVNVSSGASKLTNFPNAWAKEVPSDAESLTEERIDAVVSGFLEDFKQGSLDSKSWPPIFPPYSVSKAAVNAYTRILANRYPSFCINAVSPGFVKTDLSFNTGILTIDEGAESLVRLALLPSGGPTGHYFSRKEVTPF